MGAQGLEQLVWVEDLKTFGSRPVYLDRVVTPAQWPWIKIVFELQ